MADISLTIMLSFTLITSLLLFQIPSFKWAMLSVVIFLSTMAESSKEGFENILIGPLQTLRDSSRLLCLCGILSMALVLLAKRTAPVQRLPHVLYIFLSLQIYIHLLEIYRGDLREASLKIVTHILLFTLFAHGLLPLLNSMKTIRLATVSLVSCSVIFLTLTFAQYYFDPSAIVWQGRLYGTTGNAQHAATLLVLSIFPALWLAQTESNSIRKIIWFSVTAILIFTLVWTGSRTGFLMFLTGLAILFLKRLRKNFFVLIIGSLTIAYSLNNVLTTEASDHLFSRENTRETAWKSLFNQFLENPLFGIAEHELHFSESSYLLAGARGGIIALILVGLLMHRVFKDFSRLQSRSGDTSAIFLSDVVRATVFAYFIGAIFEGYLLSTLSFPVFLFYSLIVICNAMLVIRKIDPLPKSQTI